MWTRKAHEKKSFLSFSVSLQQLNEKENEKTEINWVVLSATLAKDKELDAIIVIAAFREWHKDDGFFRDCEGVDGYSPKGRLYGFQLN